MHPSKVIENFGRNAMSTDRCTMAQALVRSLSNHLQIIDGSM